MKRILSSLLAAALLCSMLVLPAGAAEGDWGRLVDGAFLLDPAQTEKRRQKIRGLLKDLLG